ncbi:MAG: response regulator [Candidatus Omnitrophica bacterium]|nr:response regulator [Candidatus Omnitrophota bacterium]
MTKTTRPRKKVMIVDDDAEFLEELCEMLDTSGYAVIPVREPRRAIDMADSAKPDVILLDLKMKQLSGFQIADGLSRLTGTVGIPVIAMTGFFTEHEHISLMNICGFRRCIVKPFAATDIINAIEA